MRQRAVWAFLFTAGLGLRPQAQVPEGWAAVTTTASPSNPGTGGVYLIDRGHPGTAVPVTGLGPDLTPSGANCLMVDQRNGTLLIGESAPSGAMLDVHVLTLNGASIVSDVAIPLGTSTGQARVIEMAMLPDGRVLVEFTSAIVGGQMRGASLGIIDPANATTVAPFPMPIPSPPASHPPLAWQGLDVDPTGSFAAIGYVAADPTVTVGERDSIVIWRLDGSTPPALVPWPLYSVFRDLEFDAAGAVVLQVAGGILRIDPSTGASLAPSIPIAGIARLETEAATGGFIVSALVPTCLFCVPESFVARVTPSGSASTLALGSQYGWGRVTDVAVRQTPIRFGMPSPGANTHSWMTANLPGGLPTVGNTAFSLRLASSPGCAPGVVALSLASAPGLIGSVGIPLWIEPSQIFFWSDLPCANDVVIPLPIPNVPTLAGVRIFGQAAFMEPQGLSSTDGLSLVIL